MVPEIGGTHANGINSLSEAPPLKESKTLSGREKEGGFQKPSFGWLKHIFYLNIKRKGSSIKC